MAAALVAQTSVRSLPLLSAGLFGAAACVALSLAPPPPELRTAERPRARPAPISRAFQAEPFLLRVGGLIVLTTVTALAIDYFSSGPSRGRFLPPTAPRSLRGTTRGLAARRSWSTSSSAAPSSGGSASRSRSR
jgi:hypothetical protein